MPIIVKDFSWTQSSSQVCVNLPLKGTKATNIDFLNSLEFFKVSYPPFLFECWFHASIRDENYSAVVKDGIISFQFTKEKEEEWPQLFHEGVNDKERLKEVRNNAITFAGEKATRLVQQNAKDKQENKNTALKEQMKIEAEEQEQIKAIKESEKEKLTREIERFKEIQRSLTAKTAVNEFKEEEEEESTPKSKKEPNKTPILPEEKRIFEDPPRIKNKKQEKEIPEPRSSGTIQIKLTPRVFPTPSRESQDKLEREWLEKQAEARKMTELPDEFKDLTADEKNLDWLKEKAKNYYQQENYHGAIGVYNHAIRLFPKNPALYSNRAACHFNVRNLIKCVEDCSKSLELLTPPVPANSESRIKAHVRRGTAFCHLELYAEGLLDYRAALKIDPDNAVLEEDAKKIEDIILDRKPSDCTNDVEE